MGVPRKLRVIIVRHGETRENVERIIQGQLDTDLNEKGRLQAELTGRFLSSIAIDRIISSPLRRAADTARSILSHQRQRPEANGSTSLEVEYDSRLKERAFGVLEGKVYVGAANKSEDTQGIERMEPFSERLGSFWNDLVTRTTGSSEEVSNGTSAAKETETIVLVSHGAAISALMNQVLLPGRYCILAPDVVPSRFWNCSITELLVPVIPTTSKTPAGDLARKLEWSIRPVHLGVQGSQFILDHSLQKNLLKETKAKGGEAAISPAVRDLEELVNKTQREFERDPEGKRQLEQDTIKDPDGRTVEADIGYGKAIGVVLQWSNIDHLKHLDEKSDITNAAHANSNGNAKSNVNVDELVK